MAYVQSTDAMELNLITNYMEFLEDVPTIIRKNFTSYLSTDHEVMGSFAALKNSIRNCKDLPNGKTAKKALIYNNLKNIIEKYDTKFSVSQAISEALNRKQGELKEVAAKLSEAKRKMEEATVEVTPTLKEPPLNNGSQQVMMKVEKIHNSMDQRQSQRTRRMKDCSENLATPAPVRLESANRELKRDYSHGDQYREYIRERDDEHSGSIPVPRATATIMVSAAKKSVVERKRKTSKRKAAKREQHTDDESNMDPDEETYCSCSQISYGEMICCDNDSCIIQWFHFGCVSLTSKPSGREKWYCPDCRLGDRSNVMKPKSQLLKEMERRIKDEKEKR